jgi:flagellar biosynthesis regulator FlaF
LNRVLQYGAANEVSNMTARDGEIMAFTVANTYLRECASQATRTKALHKNQQLWSILVKDIMLSQNKLPQPVKDKLIRLAFWSMSYSIRAMGAADLPLAPLISINANMIEALQLQTENAASTSDDTFDLRPAKLKAANRH